MRHLLLIGLAFAAPVAHAASAPPPPPPPIMQDGVEVIILPSVSAGVGQDSVVEVQLDVEPRTDAAIKQLGFRSMRGVSSIDCRSGANRFTRAEAFDQPGLTGQGVDRPVSGDWVTPTSDSSMFQVTQRVCANARQAVVAGPAPLVTTGSDVAAPAPQPTKPPRQAHVGALPVISTPGEAVAAVSPSTPAPAPPPPPHVIARPPPAPVAAASGGKPGNWVAQVAASPDQKDAERVLERLKAMIAPPLSPSVEAAVVNNAHLFRASVVGFGTSGEARAFCARAASVSKTCWAHIKAAPAAAPAPAKSAARR